MKKNTGSLTLGAKLKKLREDIDKTQKEVADIVGVTPAAIGHYERGYNMPNNDVLKRLADLYGVPFISLLSDADPDNVTLGLESLPEIFGKLEARYIVLAKEMQDKSIPPDDIKKIIAAIEAIKK